MRELRLFTLFCVYKKIAQNENPAEHRGVSYACTADGIGANTLEIKTKLLLKRTHKR